MPLFSHTYLASSELYCNSVCNQKYISFFRSDSLPLWSFLISYGIGFGYPLILLNPEATKKCGRNDFLEALNSNQLNSGIDGLLERGAKISDISIILDKLYQMMIEGNCHIRLFSY